VLAVLVVALLVVEVVLLAPHLSAAGSALAHADWTIVLLAVAAAAVSMIAFAAQYRQMLRGGQLNVPLRRLLAMVLAANALSATLPAGSALATGYTFQRLRRYGANGTLAAWTVVVCGLVSGAAFAALGFAGAVLVGTQTTGFAAAAGAIAAVAALAIAVRAAARRPDLMTAWAERALRGVNRVLRRDRRRGVAGVRTAVENLVVIRPRPHQWLAAVGFAALNWAADLACLVLACRAVGVTHLTAATVLVAFAADAAAGALQLLPGGIGTVDGALVLALVNGGVPASSAAAGVVIYRLITFVLAAIVGWIVWLVIRGPADEVEAVNAAPSHRGDVDEGDRFGSTAR
jgi:uncharacterized protein (TIRG00374 family)